MSQEIDSPNIINMFDYRPPINIDGGGSLPPQRKQQSSEKSDFSSNELSNGRQTSESKYKPSPTKNLPVSEKLIDLADNEKVEEGEAMSDDIIKTVGRLEANYEHMREHQHKLEASIEAMPKKIVADLAQELKNQITTLNADMTVKIGKVQSDLEVKIAGFETKIEKNAKENSRWLLGIIISIVGLYFALNNKIDTQLQSFIKFSDNVPQVVEQAPLVPKIVAPSTLIQSEKGAK